MKLANAANIEERTLYWLWPGLVPLSQCVLLEGDPGTAKSSMTIAMAAHVSKGLDWPDGSPCPKGRVVLCSSEDPAEQVIIPRLRSAGADLNQCLVMVPDDRKDSFDIPDDIPQFKELIKDKNVKLVVFDPLEAYLSGAVDNYRNHHVRRALRCVEQMASEIGCTVIFIRHLTKSVDKAAIYRGGGSMGIIGAARAALSVAHDKSTPDRSIMVPVKQNWAKIRGGIAYKRVQVDYVAANGSQITTSKIVWDGEVSVTADEIILADTEPGESGATEAASDFIRVALANGPCKADTMFTDGHKAGISRKTLWRASRLLNIHKYKEGFAAAGVWWWSLPKEANVELLKEWAIEIDDIPMAS